jgi:hypothetical protein
MIGVFVPNSPTKAAGLPRKRRRSTFDIPCCFTFRETFDNSLTVYSMMEPLSGAASVIAVIQLTGKIVEICGGYINKVKNVKQDILRLQQEIRGLTEVLEMLDNLLRGPDSSTLTTSRKLFDDVTKCSSTLTRLKEKIDPETTQRPLRRWGLRALKWPLERGEVAEAINDVKGYQSLFSLALQVDQM